MITASRARTAGLVLLGVLVASTASAADPRGSWLTEGGKGTPSQLYHFQIRPDPLAN